MTPVSADSGSPAGTEKIQRNPARPKTRFREAGKWLLWRVLPRSVYQRVLARAKARDFRSGELREPEIDLIPLVLESGGVAIDVGANHGMWTTAFSAAAGARGKVISFEPVPFTFGTLQSLVAKQRLGNVELRNKGCSDENGTFLMVVPDQDAGASDDQQSHLAGRDASDGSDGAVECEIVRLDEELGELDSVEVFKLDIEGAELKALRGARYTIAEHLPVIICEVNGEFLAGYDGSTTELEQFMTGLGYRACWYDDETKKLDRLDSLDSISHSNVVFVPTPAPERIEELIS